MREKMTESSQIVVCYGVRSPFILNAVLSGTER